MSNLSEIRAKSRSSQALKQYIKITNGGESPVTPESEANAKEVLLSIPLIKKLEAISDAHNGICSNQLKDRSDIQEAAFDEIQNLGSYSDKDMYDGLVFNDRQVHFVLGRAACGKSSVLADPLSKMFKAKLIDGDMIKTMLPGYEDGFGASFVHEESSYLSKKLITQEMINGSNLVLPKVGDNADKTIRLMKNFKEAGYTVCVHYMELNQYKALSRNLQRYVNTGRYINADVMFSAISEDGSDLISDSFEKIINSGYCDAWTKWSNDVPIGTKPYLAGHQNNISDDLKKAQYKNCIKPIIENANTDPNTIIGRSSDKPESQVWLNSDRLLLAKDIVIEQINVERTKIAESQRKLDELLKLNEEQNKQIEEALDEVRNIKNITKTETHEYAGATEALFETLEEEGLMRNGVYIEPAHNTVDRQSGED